MDILQLYRRRVARMYRVNAAKFGQAPSCQLI